jgi:hypothetical protein
MDDPVTATAKAAEATANAAGKALEIVHDAGGYLGRVFADVPADLVGALGGAWLHERHIRLRSRLRRRTEEILRERDVQEVIELSPNMAAALIAGAQEESRDELMELWARLLANAVDPKLNSVRRSFIEAVQAMDPSDAKTLNYLYRAKAGRIPLRGEGDPANKSIEYLSGQLGIRQDDGEVSVRHLEVLGFLTSTPLEPNVWFPTANLREFMRACYPEHDK